MRKLGKRKPKPLPAWFADKDGIVFRSPAKNTDHPPDLFVSANDRIQFALLCQIGKVHSVFRQSIKILVCSFAGHSRACADLHADVFQFLVVASSGLQCLLYPAVLANSQQKVVDCQMSILCDSNRNQYYFQCRFPPASEGAVWAALGCSRLLNGLNMQKMLSLILQNVAGVEQCTAITGFAGSSSRSLLL